MLIVFVVFKDNVPLLYLVSCFAISFLKIIRN